MMNNTDPIFLISDNQLWVVRLTKWRLERLFGDNVNVITGHNGEDVIRLFDEIVRSGNHVRLKAVFVGCHMPVYTGMQAVEVIRSIERYNNISMPVSIIGTTADLNENVYAEFMNAGANMVLEKPVSEGEFAQVITAIGQTTNL